MSRRGWVLFIAMSVIWGIPYLLIKVAVTDLSPFVVVFVRVAIAAALLLPVAASRGQLRQLAGYWPWIVALAAVEMCIPFGLLGWAEQHITSSLAGLLVAFVPSVSAILALTLGLDDRLDAKRAIGLGIGILGVAALVGLDMRGSQLWAAAAILVVAIGYAVGPIIMSTKLAPVPGPAMMGAALLLSSVVYLPFAIWKWPSTPVPASAWWATIALGVVCTGVAFLVFYALVSEVGPTRTTVITYLNPVVAVVLGVVVLNEPITTGMVIGFPLILLGSYLATSRQAPLESEPHA